MRRVPIGVFVVLWWVAMAAYPGWNAFDPDSQGHDWLRNFLCDLLSAETPDGRDNVAGATAMSLAMLVLVFGAMMPLWRRTPLRVACWVAAALVVLVCAEQALALPLPHGLVTLAAGAVGAAPTAVVMWRDWRASGVLVRAAIALVAAFTVANFVSYTIVQFGGALTPVVPTAQKGALCGLLLWLLLRADTN